jgi:hypothetical protein
MADLSPAAWLEVLEPRLDAQAKRAQFYRDYYDGNHPIEYARDVFRVLFGPAFRPMPNNWMQIVVDAPVERMEVQGFRFDPDPDRPEWDQEADDEAWAIWQANNLDELSRILHTEVGKCGRAFTMVDPNNGDPRITIESPMQVVVATSPGDPRRRLAALKRWGEDDGYAYATVYLPDSIHKFRSSKKVRDGARTQWARRSDDPGGVNRLGVVPMIPFENNPDMLDGGRSDLEAVTPMQDALNLYCLDMQRSSQSHASPQKWATGWQVPRNPDGSVSSTAALRASVSSVWAAESADTKFGQLSPGDVSNYLEPVEMWRNHIAAVSRTPAYYLTGGSISNLSAETVKALDTGLVYRCKGKHLSYGASWEETQRLTFLAKGDLKRAGAMAAETIWADPEARSLAQTTDAAVKLRESLDVPAEVAWQIAGFSPQQIKQMLKMNGWTAGGAANGPSTNGSDDPSRVVVEFVAAPRMQPGIYPLHLRVGWEAQHGFEVAI